MASLGHTRAVARVFGVPLTGFAAWWFRRTYYLFQMPRWDRRLRIVLDWTVALFFRPDITKVELRVEREQVKQVLGAAPADAACRCLAHLLRVRRGPPRDLYRSRIERRSSAPRASLCFQRLQRIRTLDGSRGFWEAPRMSERNA